MKATWNSGRQHRLTTAFVAALLFGGGVTPDHRNPNVPGNLAGFDDNSLQLIVDEGRRQLDRQADKFRHITDRAQVLLTISLALAGFVAATLHQVEHLHGTRKWISLSVWGLSALLTIIGVAATASVVVVRATFSGVDTTQISNWTPPVLAELAGDYADAVRLGETTIDARVTMFRSATRFVCYGGVFAAVAFGLAS